MNKAQVVAEGLRLKVPYEYTWSCYEGKERPCGVCGTCIDRQRAFEANGVEDPALYRGKKLINFYRNKKHSAEEGDMLYESY